MSPYILDYLSRCLARMCKSQAFSFHLQLSGLEANLSKSELYIGGVNAQQKALLADTLLMELGSFPMKYLGVPLAPYKLLIRHCQPLIDQMAARKELGY